MATLTAWDGTVFDMETLGEAKAYADLNAYVLTNPMPQPEPPPEPEPAPPTRDSVLEEGYTDQPTGIKIKAVIYDQSRFTSLVSGLLNDFRLGKINDASVIYFYQFDGSATGLPYLTFSEMMSRYKDHCQHVESLY